MTIDTVLARVTTSPSAAPVEVVTPIKASEAIRLGCLTTGPGEGAFWPEPGLACALGAMATGFGWNGAMDADADEDPYWFVDAHLPEVAALTRWRTASSGTPPPRSTGSTTAPNGPASGSRTGWRDWDFDGRSSRAVGLGPVQRPDAAGAGRDLRGRHERPVRPPSADAQTYVPDPLPTPKGADVPTLLLAVVSLGRRCRVIPRRRRPEVPRPVAVHGQRRRAT